MKFLPLRDFEMVTSALNFQHTDCQVIGGCDLYTTKAAGSDKKLYRNIENSLESQYESLLRLSESVSPEPSGQPALNLSRSSPFGPLSQVSSRRTFAYLIATLNASHTDYDFSHILRPADFRKERSLKAVIGNIDSTLSNLRPSAGMTLQVPPQTSYATTASAPATSQVWGPNMWSLIDQEMTLKECTVYCWAPPDDPFDGEEGSIWSLNYFFFNKERKRIAYIYLRGVPVMSHSPTQRIGISKRSHSENDAGANKRARYWLGDQAANVTNGEEADLEDSGIKMWSDEVDPDDADILFDGDDFCDDYEDEADDESDEHDYKAPVRGMSEDIVASMDMD
ncbi:Repressor of RNA polymerase III transcription [Lachnellula hyalina]|uniref:Repressor of RNA polymerase III transcription MAF1 n=1 Tax=Lachnellula hyalina TaxID=1316788 RepID=A0A8H8RA79_9HELO|nr:Repressor of RNA polymerase III transcription [Lachnellula hyalina]TVY31211.1 Repressor of RNA polymerase III transcription [Lachnellula hyalina]